MLKLKVDEMSCGHCASTVQKAVKSVDPVAQVSVDLPPGDRDKVFERNARRVYPRLDSILKEATPDAPETT